MRGSPSLAIICYNLLSLRDGRRPESAGVTLPVVCLIIHAEKSNMQNFETRLSETILSSIRAALKEDIGSGDVTTNSIVPLEARMKGQIIAKQSGILAGLDVAQAAYHLFDAEVIVDTQVEEGARVEKGQILAFVSGHARSLLTVERTALNFLGRMSGIATLTRRYVDAVAGTQAVILDTRKTAPGLRMVDKLA